MVASVRQSGGEFAGEQLFEAGGDVPEVAHGAILLNEG